MKKFKFKLEAVSILRRLKKEQAMNLLAKAVQSRIDVESQIRNKNKEMKELNEEIIRARKCSFMSSKQAQYLSQLDNLYLEKSCLEENVNECIIYENTMRVNLLEATKDEKIMDKLHEKRKKDYIFELLKREEKELDDLMNFRNERYKLKAV